MPGALEDVRVIDFTHALNGPFCTMLLGHLGAQTRQTIWAALRDLGYFGAPVLSIVEVLEDPHIEARQAFVVREHPTAGTTTLLAPWIRMSKTPSTIRQDAPASGQHTGEVLSALLGLSAAEVGELRSGGIVK